MRELKRIEMKEVKGGVEEGGDKCIKQGYSCVQNDSTSVCCPGLECFGCPDGAECSLP